MKLIVVTTPTFFVEEDKIITALFEEGLDVLHLRKPETPAMYSERLLTLIPDKYHRRIVTHEHFYLKEELLWSHQLFVPFSGGGKKQKAFLRLCFYESYL